MQTSQNHKLWNWAKLLGIYAGIFALLAIFYVAQDLLNPFLVAFILVYMLNPIADKIEGTGIKRSWSVTLLFLGFALTIAFVVFLSFNSIKAEFTTLTTNAPEYVAKIKTSLEESSTMLEQHFSFIEKGYLKNQLDQKYKELPTQIAQQIPTLIPMAINLVTTALIILFTTFFILKDGREFRKDMIKVVPNKYFETVLILLHEINVSVGSYVRGQIIDCAIVGLLSVIGLYLLGLKYAIIIGLICGIMNIIPYLGPVIGMIPGIFVALIEHHSPGMAVSVVAVMMLVQLIDNVAISPLAVGQSVDLHPLIVILAVSVGGALMGVWGMLLAVPVYCALKVTFQILYKGIIEYGSWDNA